VQRLTSSPAEPAPVEHAEGPVWDAAAGELLWVDIPNGQVHRARIAPDGVMTPIGSARGGDTVGFVLPAAAGGWVLGAGGGISHLEPDGSARVLVDLVGEGGSPDDGGTRMNDGACDRAGRFFGGTMAFDQRPGAGALYRLDTDGTVSTVLDGLTVSNGLGWSPDERTVYLADSGPGLVYAFDYDPDGGTFTEQRVLLDFTDQVGVADGLTVDDEGCLWTAVWGRGQVRRWSPDGELLAVVEVPVAQVSSCCFAGPGRDLLVISTSTEGMDDDARAAVPDAGRLFTARPGVTGPPANPYRGRLAGLSQLP